MKNRWLIVATSIAISACGNQQSAWEVTERDDTPNAYLEFLAKYPEGEFAEHARQRLEQLKEIRAWERSQFRDNENAYRDFIENFPNSNFIAPANERLAELNRDSEWENVEDSEDPNALNDFLARYPDAPQAAEAQILLAEIVASTEPEQPTERPGDFRLQLATFRTASAADTEVRRLIDLFPETLIGPIRIQTPAESQDNKFRLFSVPMNKGEATTACNALKKYRQNCLIIPAR
jgi:hypothetical protein